MPIRLIVLTIYAVILLILATLPPLHVPVQPIEVGITIKPAHVAAFLVLTILLRYTADVFFSSPAAATRRALVVSFAFGVLIESIQYFIPYRSGQLIDLVSNAIGIALGLAVISLIRRSNLLSR